MSSHRRFLELGGLRGLAALAVVLYHYLYHYNSLFGHSFAIADFLWIGYYGVHFFFMISGFVIFWTISRTTKALDFIWSRFSRRYPVYWAALSLTFIFVALFSLAGHEQNFYTYLVNVSMFQEFFGYNNVDGSYWTLALELAFYIWILLLFQFKQIVNIERIVIGWLVIAVALTSNVLGFSLAPIVRKIFLLDYIELFGAGICFFKFKNNQQTLFTYLLISLCFLTLYIRYPITIAAALSGFFILFMLAISNKLRFLQNPVFVSLGQFHIPYT